MNNYKHQLYIFSHTSSSVTYIINITYLLTVLRTVRGVQYRTQTDFTAQHYVMLVGNLHVVGGPRQL